MTFIYPIDTATLLNQRAVQMRRWGIPNRLVQAARSRIRDMWRDGPGGWAHEWTRLADHAEQEEAWFLASLLHGAAKFPFPVTDAQQAAYRRQIACFERAIPRFKGTLDRLEWDTSYGASKVKLVVHVYRRHRRKAGVPVLCLTGGVDTWKVELHRLATLLRALAKVDVVLFDMPGTGESGVLLRPDSDLVYHGVVDNVREWADQVGVMGISWGGHWGAKLGLQGVVDWAVDLGGPVFADVHRLPAMTGDSGMVGVVGNALGLSHFPTGEEIAEWTRAFSLREQGLLDAPADRIAPMLVVNGANDPFVPRSDALVFQRLPRARVWLVRGAGHCAVERLPIVVTALIGWLRDVTRNSIVGRVPAAIAQGTVQPFLYRPGSGRQSA